MTFSRGLTTGWLAGTNHPYLTHGKFGKKRGPFLGTIIEAQNGWIRLDTPPSAQTPPLKAGDGIVFDAGENRDLEQGASIWKIENDRIIFHRTFSGINFDRIRPGVTLYKTADPALESEIRKFWQNAKPKQKKTPIHLTLTGQPGQPLIRSCPVPGQAVQTPSRGVSSSTTIPLTASHQPPPHHRNPGKATLPPRRHNLRTLVPRKQHHRRLPPPPLRPKPTPPRPGRPNSKPIMESRASSRLPQPPPQPKPSSPFSLLTRHSPLPPSPS